MTARAVTPAKPGAQALTLWSIIRTRFTIVACVNVSAWIGRWLERRIRPGPPFRAAGDSANLVSGFGLLPAADCSRRILKEPPPGQVRAPPRPFGG